MSLWPSDEFRDLLRVYVVARHRVDNGAQDFSVLGYDLVNIMLLKRHDIQLRTEHVNSHTWCGIVIGCDNGGLL